MVEIRLRFAGMIGFLAKILSLITGLIFTMLITRNLSVIEFGQWNILNSLLVYGVFPASLLGYWYTRYTARNTPIAKTGVLISFLFIVIGIIVFFATSKILADKSQLFLPIIIFASLQVPTSSLVNVLQSIASGKKPEITSYGFIIFELAKVTIAFIVVFLKGLTLLDAIIIVIIAEAIQASSLAILIRNEIRKNVNFSNIKIILKSIWIPIFNQVGDLILMADVFIVTIITSSITNVAIFKVGLVFSAIVSYGGYLAYPLYIKLLGGGKSSDVLVSTKLMLTFTIPLAVGIFVLAKPLLFLLNPQYTYSERILQILVLYNFSVAINSIFITIFLGTETVEDLTLKRSGLKKILRSAHVMIPSLGIVRLGVYVISLTIFSIISLSQKFSASQFGEIWALILFVTTIPITLYTFKLARERVHFTFPSKNVVKYILSSSIMAAVLLYSMTLLTYNPKITLFIPQLAIIILMSIVIYFAVLSRIDKDTKDFLKQVFSMIRK